MDAERGGRGEGWVDMEREQNVFELKPNTADPGLVSIIINSSRPSVQADSC